MAIILGLLFLFIKQRDWLPERVFKVLCWAMITGAFAVIGLALWKIDPLSVRVDRWSATSYFLDALFDGRYPYGVHTHVPPTAHSFPSPFPLWQYINIPFWLMGDVGFGLFFFLLLSFVSVRWFAGSYKKALLFLLLLLLSPAYWWEVAVRSDGLRNALLIFCLIFYIEKRRITFSTHWWAVVVAILFFVPYVLWDTETWIFFSRNPFMEQTRQGNFFVTCTVALLGIMLALRSKTFMQCIHTISLMVFLFILLTQIVLFADDGLSRFLLNDDCDISYFTLSFPYCLFALSSMTSNPAERGRESNP